MEIKMRRALPISLIPSNTYHYCFMSFFANIREISETPDQAQAPISAAKKRHFPVVILKAWYLKRHVHSFITHKNDRLQWCCDLVLGESKYSPGVEPAWKEGSAIFSAFYKALLNEPDPGLRRYLHKVARSWARKQVGLAHSREGLRVCSGIWDRSRCTW